MFIENNETAQAIACYVGTSDATDEFISAVENNPVLEGRGNKIIYISQP